MSIISAYCTPLFDVLPLTVRRKQDADTQCNEYPYYLFCSWLPLTINYNLRFCASIFGGFPFQQQIVIFPDGVQILRVLGVLHLYDLRSTNKYNAERKNGNVASISLQMTQQTHIGEVLFVPSGSTVTLTEQDKYDGSPTRDPSNIFCSLLTPLQCISLLMNYRRRHHGRVRL